MNNKDARIEIRLRPEEKLVVEKLAKEAGCTISQWIRMRILIDKPVKKPS